eukprot:CAMPEP_0172832366 /NCGR_PEP_ID=MMETSP1075-20121228/23606_1 /TAXON_ID=2916 /ORGANISM="Ceratium fusus, Strain PA161109" /LENGTH=142 /DNA_ID=CAMNT_0013674953 /DNA_START=138 /DNA_END=562 /DNA_ORIENTATION=-
MQASHNLVCLKAHFFSEGDAVKVLYTGPSATFGGTHESQDNKLEQLFTLESSIEDIEQLIGFHLSEFNEISDNDFTANNIIDCVDTIIEELRAETLIQVEAHSSENSADFKGANAKATGMNQKQDETLPNKLSIVHMFDKER